MDKNKLKKENKFKKGFTLIEMIVAIALFSTVMVVGMGSLLNVLAASKKSQDIQTAVNNLSLAMETMSREIRTGSNYHCSSEGVYKQYKNCVEGDSLIAFEAFDGNSSVDEDQIVFDLKDGQIRKSEDEGAHFLSMTSDELTVEGLTFVVVGAGTIGVNKPKQPKVLITTHGYVGDENAKESEKVFFNLQTTISQRKIDTRD
ncbi:MAG: type II secretion system protein [Candidatus Pacebacteria bacterium]|nr:type II secretion system protein [Candidatus Paceibacterota bacterium]